MASMTSAPAPAPQVPRRVRPPPRERRRVRTAVLAILLVAATGFVATHPRQTWSYLTHWNGPPEQTWPAGPLAGDPLLRLAAIGDVGDGGDDVYVTAAAMYEQDALRPYDVVYLLGDNVYPYGDPDQLDRRVLRPLRSLIDQGVELRAILGNHDIMLGRGDEQLERLGMPARWHAVERNGVLLVGLYSEEADDPDQLAWLEQALSASDATWKILFVHRPPYSAGYQGSDTGVRTHIVPVLQRHGVQLVVSGHDHDYQRSVPLDGTVYIVSGAGADTRRTGTHDFTAYAAAVNHFVDIAVYEDRIDLRAIEHLGSVFDEVAIGLDGTVTARIRDQ